MTDCLIDVCAERDNEGLHYVQTVIGVKKLWIILYWKIESLISLVTGKGIEYICI